jgi:hypothetical protein
VIMGGGALSDNHCVSFNLPTEIVYECTTLINFTHEQDIKKSTLK